MTKTNELDLDMLALLKARLASTPKYMWVASCDDGAFQEWSEKGFDTKEEAYNDMRNHALDKMKWNTEYKEDFESDDDFICYDVTFKKDKIEHNSYSGRYIYEVVPYDYHKLTRFDFHFSLKGRSEEEVAVIENIITKKLKVYMDELSKEFKTNIEEVKIFQQ